MTQRYLSLASISLVFILGGWIGAFAPKAQAQDAGRIAVVVNEDAITLLDVFERMAIIFATTGIEDSQEARRRLLPQILRTLVDEQLQLQEGRRKGLEEVILDFNAAYRIVEQNLGLGPGQLEPFFAYNNLNLESLNQQLKAEVIWSELVERRSRNDEITEDDIEDELDRMRAAANQPAFLLAEICQVVDDPSREPEIKANAWRLRDAIMSGASFPGLAQQFSQCASASEGGDLGWIIESQLSDELLAVAPGLEVGELSEPIKVIGGFTLILMREKRIGFDAQPADVQLTMRQAIFPATADNSAEVQERAAVAASSLRSCDDLDVLGEADPTLLVGSSIEIRLGDLQESFQEAVRPLTVGQASAPVETQQGYHVIVLCERTEVEPGLPSTDEIAAMLRSQQFDLISRGYMRDLRRTAFVDIRI
ncbi:MAG: hypothetical protein CMM46_18390 [Rhodospirillaceae bacterium]|nr:hypothetical protein [Rhodospirillaceae bacterium]|tara:strand:- start:1297 stop:2565 length:1269 start_codon:yes stop_codon:yes gene_type:complete